MIYSTFSKRATLFGIIFIFLILIAFPKNLVIPKVIGIVFCSILCFNYTITIINLSKRTVKTISLLLIPIKIKTERLENFDKIILKPFNRLYAVAKAWNIFLSRKNGNPLLLCYGLLRTPTNNRAQELAKALSLPYETNEQTPAWKRKSPNTKS